MKITATGGGGYAGLSERYEIDTETSAAGAALEAEMAACGFFDAPAAAPGAPADEAVGADLPRWTITATVDGRRHAVSFAEDGSAASRPWQELLARIRAAD